MRVYEKGDFTVYVYYKPVQDMFQVEIHGPVGFAVAKAATSDGLDWVVEDYVKRADALYEKYREANLRMEEIVNKYNRGQYVR